MKRKHIVIISLLIISAWAVGYFNQHYRAPKIEYVEIEKLQTVIDSIYVEKLVEKKARTSNAKSLKERISRNEERVKSARGRQRRKSKQVDLDDLDLNF